MIKLREVAPGYAGPTAECPSCHRELGLPSPVGATIRSPRDIAAVMQLRMGGLEREELHVLILSAKNRVLRDVTVYVGNVSASLVRVGEVFTEAVRDNAAGIVIVHNHPSGDPTPSPDDLHLTANVIAAGRLLDIDVLDHVIVSGEAYVSLRDRGVVFDRVINAASVASLAVPA